MTQEATKVVRAGLERLCKEFSGRISDLGFARTKKMFWIRPAPLVIQFIHLFREGSTYGAPLNFSVSLRVHFGIRVLNDSFVAAALNGPWSDVGVQREGRYHLRFNAQTGSTYERCLEDLVRFVREHGEPWFQRFASVDSLVNNPSSPLKPEAKELLVAAASGQGNLANEMASLKIFGVQ